MSWTASTNHTRYLLQESTNSGFANPSSFTLSATTASKPFSHVISTDTRYYYRIAAENEDTGEASGWSNTDSTLVSTVSATGGLNVTVRNQNGATTSGATVIRYTCGTPPDCTEWGYIDQKTTNSSGVASWMGIGVGCYNLEAYSNGEYWVNDTNVCVSSGSTASKPLQRNEPYAYDFKVKRVSDGADVTGGSVAAGTPLRAEMSVTNDSPVSRLVRIANLRIDRNQSSPYDHEQSASGSQTIGADRTRVFTYNFTPTATGTYKRSFETETTVNGWAKTDSWAWGTAVDVVQQEQVLNEYVWVGSVQIPDGCGWDCRVNWPVNLSGAPSNAHITRVSVEYWIGHTYVGDLKVWLTTERSGQWYDRLLWDQEGGSSDDIHEIESNLNNWDGLSPNGTWYLMAADYVDADVGQIDRWEIWVYYTAP